MATIDAIETPLSPSPGARERQQWNAKLRVHISQQGATLSATPIQGFGRPQPATSNGGRVASPTRADGNGLVPRSDPKASQTAADRSTGIGGRTRLDPFMRNLFAARPRIETFTTGTTIRFDPWPLEPVGRFVTSTLQPN